MKLAMIPRVAVRAALVRRIPRGATAAIRVVTAVRPLSSASLADRAAAMEREVQQGHYQAAHASDGSRGDWDQPKSKEEMEQLHNLYHKIDALETELAALKEEARQQQRIFAVEAPDGESDAHLQEELEEVKHMIDDAAVLEKKEEVEKKHQREQEVKKYHGMFRLLIGRCIIFIYVNAKHSQRSCLPHTMMLCPRPNKARDPEHDW